jgi:transcriptional regulator with XRE-family HTH domain
MSRNPFEEDRSSTLCIDAAAVKNIREMHRLTQLYVSKVVGVTTDTISRWENNRYPTIRRDNAIKLAEALDVSLEDILLKPIEEANAPTASAKSRAPLGWLVVLALAVLVLSALYASLQESPSPPVPVTAARILPTFAAPGSTLPVQIKLTHRAEQGGIILREYFPRGWTIIQSSPPASSLDNVNGVARWIIKADENRDRVVYLIQVAPEARGSKAAAFQGEVVASQGGNRSAVAVQGGESIAVAPVHWADSNGDGRIDDGEMLEGSFTIEDMAGVYMDWNDLEALWDAGSYRWDGKAGVFLPVESRESVPPAAAEASQN